MDDLSSNVGNNESVSKNLDFTNKTWKDDITFVIEGKQLHASKCVLAMYSPVFEAMFCSEFKEKEQGVIELPDKKADDFVEFLQCIYPTSNNSVTQANFAQVLPLADEYQVSSLIENCEEIIEEYIKRSEDNLTTNDLLRCYAMVTRHGLKNLETLCVDELVSKGNFEKDSDMANQYLSEKEILQLQKKIISVQENRLEDVTTQLVKLFITAKGKNVESFENAKGVKMEHVVIDVFSPELLDDLYNKPANIWNVRFSTLVSISHKVEQGQYAKYLSVYLRCQFPNDGEEWSCDVKAFILLENTSTDKNQLLTSKYLHRHYTSDSVHFGYENFENLSKFLTGTGHAVRKYSCKLVVYLLANKPTQNVDSDF